MNSIFSLLFNHKDLTVGSGLAEGWYLMFGELPQKLTAKNKQNWMMADRWYSPKQVGSQEHHLCPLRLEGNCVVWRCSCCKEKGLSPRSNWPWSRLLQLACMYCQIVHQFGRQWWLVLGLNRTIFQFLGSRMFLGAPRKLYSSVAFCDCCEVWGKWCQHNSLEQNNDLQVLCVWIVPISY